MIRCGTDLDGITEKAMHKVGEVAKTKSDQTLALYTEEEIKSATKTCTAPKNSASSKTEVNVSEVSSTSGEAQQPRASTKSIFMDLYDEGVVDLLTVNSAFGAQKSGDKFPSAETNFKPRQIEFKKDSKQALSLVQEYVDSETEEDKEDVVKETDKKIAPVVKTSSEKSADVETSTSVDNDAVSELKNVSDQNVNEPDITSGKSSSKELSASIKTEVSKKEASKEEKDIRQNAAAKTDKVKEEGQISESDSSNSLSSSDEKHSKKPRESKRDKHRKKRTKEKKKKKKKRKKRRYRGRSIESGSESDKGVKRKKRNRSNSNEKPAKSRQRKRSKSKSREKVSDRRHRSRSRSNSREKRKRQRHGKEKRTRSTSRSRSRSRSRSPIRRYSRSKQRKNSKTFSSRSRSPNKSSSPSAWRKRQRSLSSGRSPSRNSQSSYKRWKSRSKTPQRRLSSGGRKRRSSPLSKSPTRRVLSAVRRKSTPERKRKRSLSSPESPIRRSRSPKRKRDPKKRPSLEQKHPRRLSSGSGNFKRALSKRTDSDEESSDSSSSSGKSPVRVKRAAVSVLRPQLKAAESLKKISQSDRKDSKSLRRKLSGEEVSIGKSSAKKATAQKQGDSAAIRSVVRSAGPRKNFKSLRRKLWDEEVSDGKSLGKKPAVQKQGDSGAIRSSVKSAKSGKQNSRSATKSTPRNFVKISFSYSDESDQESIDTNLPEKKSPAVEKTDNVTFSCHVKLAEMKSAEIKRESDLKDSESLKEISASKALDELEAKSSDVKSSEGKSPVIEKTDVSAFKSPKKATESTKETLGSDREDFKKVPESNKTELDEESADSESLGKLSPAPEKTDSVAVTSQIQSTEAAKRQSPSPSPAKLDDDEFDFVFTGHLTPKQGSEKSVEDMIFAGEPFMSDAMIWDVKKPASTPNTKQRAKETPAVESQTSGNDGSQGPDALIENNAEKEGIIDTDVTDVHEVESQEVNTTKSETALHVEENVQSDIPEDLQDNVKPAVETSVKEGQQSPLRDNHFVEAGDVEQDDEAPECKESPNKGESNVSAFVASKVETIPFLDEMPPPPPPMIGASGPHPSRRGPLPTPPHCHSWQDPFGESIGQTQHLWQLDQEPLGHPLKLGVAGHLSSHESNSRSVAGLPGFLGQSVQPPQGPHLSLLSRLGKIGFLQNVPPLGDVNSAQANLAREQLTRFGGNEINPGRNDLCPLPVPVQEEGNVMFEYSPIDMEMSSPEGDIIDKMNEEFWKQQHEDSGRELEELEARNAFVEHGTIELFPADEPYEPETGLLIDDMEEDFNDIMDPKERKKRRKEKQHEKTKVQTLIDKLHRQARVEEEVKHVLKVYYKHRDIDKEEYKNILRRAVPQVTNSGSSIDPERIRSLVKKYVAKIKGQRILAV